MKNEDFKLLVEGFNKFLLNEHIGHTAQCTKLFDAIPSEFAPYINDTMSWYNGDAWIAETDHDNLDDEEDQKLLFEEVAKACGCSVKDLLVHFDDNFADDIDYGSAAGSLNSQDFLRSYNSNGTLCGSFEIDGASLKGFYFMLGTDETQFGIQFDGAMSSRSLKGLIFVAPNCSGAASTSSQKSTKQFKSKLGGAWG